MNNADQSFGPPPISDPALRPFLDGDDEAGLANRPMSVLERPRARSIGGAYRCKVFGFLGCGGSPAGTVQGRLTHLPATRWSLQATDVASRLGDFPLSEGRHPQFTLLDRDLLVRRPVVTKCSRHERLLRPPIWLAPRYRRLLLECTASLAISLKSVNAARGAIETGCWRTNLELQLSAGGK